MISCPMMCAYFHWFRVSSEKKNGKRSTEQRRGILMQIVCLTYTVSEKKRPRYFQQQLWHFLVDFYNFCTIENRNEYFTTIRNLLT